MKKIKIYEEFANTDEMANTLQTISDLIEEGYTSGYYPAWAIYETNDEENDSNN